MSKAFWVKFRFVDDISDDDGSKMLDEFDDFIESIQCTIYGGPANLVHANDEKQDVTDAQRQMTVQFLEQHKSIQTYQVSEFVDLEEAREKADEMILKALMGDFTSGESLH